MVAAALVAFSPFTPLLFQGEEWGASSPFCFFAEFGDPQLVDAVREGRKAEFATFVGVAGPRSHGRRDVPRVAARLGSARS